MRFPSRPHPELSLPLTRMTEAPEQDDRISATQTRSAAVSPPARGDPDARLRTAHPYRRTSLRGGRAPASHTCPGPSKALTFPRLPSAKSSGEFTVTGYRQLEKWPRKEALSPAPAPGHARSGHPSCHCPQGRTAKHLWEVVRTLLTHLCPQRLPRKAYVVSTLAFTPTMASSKPEIGFWQSQE